MFKKQNKLINKNVSDYSYNDINELEWSLQSMFDNWLESTAKINTKNFITNDLETNLNLEFMFSPKPDSLCKIEFENNNSVLQFITQNQVLQPKFIEVVNNRFHFNLLNSEVAFVNKLFIENGFEVKSLIPMRSFEDYFLNLT